MLSQKTVRQFKKEKTLVDQRNLTENAFLVLVCYYIYITPAGQPLKGELFLFKIFKINTSLVSRAKLHNCYSGTSKERIDG